MNRVVVLMAYLMGYCFLSINGSSQPSLSSAARRDDANAKNKDACELRHLNSSVSKSVDQIVVRNQSSQSLQSAEDDQVPDLTVVSTLMDDDSPYLKWLLEAKKITPTRYIDDGKGNKRSLLDWAIVFRTRRNFDCLLQHGAADASPITIIESDDPYYLGRLDVDNWQGRSKSLLGFAREHNKIGIINWLLKNKIKMLYQQALKCDYHDDLKFLLENNLHQSVGQPFKRAQLDEIMHQSPRCFRLLLNHSATNRVIYDALENEDLVYLKMLLDSGLDPNKAWTTEAGQLQCLLECAFAGDKIKAFDLLLKYGAKPYEKIIAYSFDPEYDISLFMKLLESKKLDPNAILSWKGNAWPLIQWAAVYKRYDHFRILLDHDADIPESVWKLRDPVLSAKIARRFKEQYKLLVKAGILS